MSLQPLFSPQRLLLSEQSSEKEKKATVRVNCQKALDDTSQPLFSSRWRRFSKQSSVKEEKAPSQTTGTKFELFCVEYIIEQRGGK